MPRKITRPIFIVGVPRSGTTLLYRRLCEHPDLAWISKTGRKFPRSVLLTRLISLVHRDRRPTEASWIWSRYTREEDDVLLPEHITPESQQFYTDVFGAQLALSSGSRFLSKYPRNALRMAYFQKMFPDAMFLHLIRDGRAAANSILRCRERHSGVGTWWGIRPPGWRDLLDQDPAEACGRQWQLTVNYTRQSAKELSEGSYREVRYEDFVSRPGETLREIGGWCGLEWTEELLASLSEGIESRNPKWRTELTEEQIARLGVILADTLGELGYDV